MAFNLQLPQEAEQEGIPLSTSTASIIDEWAKNDTEIQKEKEETTPRKLKDYKEALNNPKPSENTLFGDIGDVVTGTIDTIAETGSDFKMGVIGAGAEFIQGAEDLIVDSGLYAGESMDRISSKLNEVLGGGQSPYEGLDMEDTKALREEKADKIHNMLKVDTAVKAVLGDDYSFPTTEGIIKANKKHSEVIDESDSTLRKGAYLAGEVATYIGAWEASAVKLLSRKGITTIVKDGLKVGKSPKDLRLVKDIVPIAGAEGVLSGVQGVGRHFEDEDQYNQAVVDGIYGAAFAGALSAGLKGVGFAAHNWYTPLVHAEGDKVVASLSDHAIEESFKGDKKAFKDAIDRYGKASEAGSWDNMSNLDKLPFLSGLSRVGERTAHQVMGDLDAFSVMIKALDASSEEGKKMLKEIDLLAEETAKGGKRIQHILTQNGLIPSGKGVDMPNNYGLEYKWMDAIIPNRGGTKSQIAEVQDVLRAFGNIGKNRLESLGIQALKDGKKPEKMHLSEFVDSLKLRLALKPKEKILKEQGIDPANPKAGELPEELMNNEAGTALRRKKTNHTVDAVVQTLKEEGAIEKKTIGYTQDGEPIIGDVVSITPEGIYKAYTAVRDSIGLNRGLDSKVAERLSQQSKSVLIDLLDHVGYGANYKKILTEAMNAYGNKKALLERVGLKALVEGGDSTLSSKDITNMYLKVVKNGINKNGGSNDYIKFMENLSREDQVLVEKAIIGSVIEQGNKTLSIISKSKGDSSAIESAIKNEGIDSLRSAEETLGALSKLVVTKEGRQLVDMAQTLLSSTRGITRGFHTAVVEETLNTAIMRGVRGYLSKVFGSVQSRKEVVTNIPYMTAKIKAMGEIAQRQGTHNNAPVSVESYKRALKAGHLTFSEPVQIRAGIELARMFTNMARIGTIEGDRSALSPFKPKSSYKVPTPPAPKPVPEPYTPTNAPTPTGTPPTNSIIPKGLKTDDITEIKLSQGVLDRIIKNGRLSDHAQLLPAEMVQLHETQKQLVKNILESKEKVHVSGNDGEHWKAFNEEILKAQTGKGVKVVIDPSGTPMVIVGTKGIPVAKKANYGKAGNKRDWLHSLLEDKRDTSTKKTTSVYNILDKDYLQQIGKLVGKPDMFDNLKVKLVKRSSSQMGSYNRLTEEISVNVNNRESKDPYYMEKIVSTLTHEMQHHIQNKLNIPQGGNISIALVEQNKRLNTIISNLGLNKLPETEKTKVKMLLKKGVNISTLHPVNMSVDRIQNILGLQKLIKKYNVPVTATPHEAVIHIAKSRGEKIEVGDSIVESMSNILHPHKIYESIVGEAQANFVGKLATAKGVDIGDTKAFTAFIEDTGKYLDFIWTTNPNYKSLTNDILNGTLLKGH